MSSLSSEQARTRAEIGERSSVIFLRLPLSPWVPSLFGVCFLLLALAGLLLLFLNRDVPKPDRWGFWGFQSLMALMVVSSGMLLTRRNPRHPIGWMLLLAGLFAALTGLSEEFTLYTLYLRPELIPLGILVAGLFNWMWVFSYALIAIFIPLLFPNGRLLSPRWRVVAWMGTLWMVAGSAWMVLLPAPLPNNGGVENPFGLELLRGSLATNYDPRSLILLLGMVLMMAAALSLVLRYRRARDMATRQQIKWVMCAALLVPFAGMLGYISGVVANAALMFSAAAMPAAFVLAVLRYRLYDIDLLISRTLVYIVLTALVVGVYALAVAAAGLLAQSRGSPWVALLAATLAAFLFHPWRTRLQQGVNRLLYGQRDTPLAVLSQLGRRMEEAVSPEAMLTTLAETVARALKLPYVAVALEGEEGPTVLAEYGRPTQEVYTFPLRYRGQSAGQLRVAPRQPRETLHDADRALLENIARQAGAAAHAARLTADLRRSRQRLVAAREEERRRLRRDLHDDLGPRLASMTLTIEAIARLVERDAAQARTMLHHLKEQAQEAVQEIRRLVHDLRPPALDDLGLTAALQECAARYAPSGVRITVEAPESLPPLPAAVEVAAFRIAQEAMTNAVRHAQARTCRVTLQLEVGHLRVIIEDDGRGLPSDLEPGVGLHSMRERVDELGGWLTLNDRPGGGTLVEAWLPWGGSVSPDAGR